MRKRFWIAIALAIVLSIGQAGAQYPPSTSSEAAAAEAVVNLYIAGIISFEVAMDALMSGSSEALLDQLAAEGVSDDATDSQAGPVYIWITDPGSGPNWTGTWYYFPGSPDLNLPPFQVVLPLPPNSPQPPPPPGNGEDGYYEWEGGSWWTYEDASASSS